ncbi:MAG TPA: hypothetical protein VFV38_09950 [Ktedonobacteraceae bacterium]|nr:hypothetical protein [Ktedonobacteraceae bacterium]
MLDDMFSFIDPIIEFAEDDTARLVIQLETFYDFIEKTGLDKVASLSEGTRIEVPLDLALSLLKPNELEKLQKYITSYLANHHNREEN